MGIETQTMKPRPGVDKIQVYDTRKRTRSSAAGGTGDANMTTTSITSITFPAAAAAAVPAAGATEDAAFHPRKKMRLAAATTAFNDDGWGEFFKNRDNFVEMHIF